MENSNIPNMMGGVFNSTITASGTVGTTVTTSVPAYGKSDLFINQISVQVYNAGLYINEKVSTAMEEITIAIRDGNGANFSINAMDLWAFKELFANNVNFNGFILGKDTPLTFDFTHTAVSWTGTMKYVITLHGYKI